MASCGIAFACFLIFSLQLEAKSENFVNIDCQKSEIIAQYGTNTLLDCVARTKESNPQIILVTWKLNKNTVLHIRDGQFKKKEPGFEYAVSSWDASNLNVSLLITNTDLTNAGEYKCAVVLDVGEGKTSDINLTVKANYSKPEIRSEPETRIADKSFSLTCTARGGYPEGDIRWVVDGDAWKMNPQVQVKKDTNGLFDLTSTLSFGPDSRFETFVCEVYNAKGVKEDQQEMTNQITNPAPNTGVSGPSHSHIVAPAVVIGSLIVGLLIALMVCRRRRQNETPNEPEEQNPMV